ncbi:MAG: hypothetical protein AAF696_17565 [Bacteroidota bacterium]
MKSHIISLLILLLPLSLQAQWDSLGNSKYASLILKDIPTAEQIEVDAEGNIFLLDTDGAKLYKYFASHQYDSVRSIGGVSTREEGFLHPVKLALKNRQDFYVLDDLGRKIILLDKELKLVESFDLFAQFSERNSAFPDEFEPLSFDMSPAGETYLLNNFNHKIYKINSFGRLESEFGGLDYGPGSLYEPVDLQVGAQNRIYVADVENQEIKVFDMFGVFLQSLDLIPDFDWQHFHIHQSLLLLWNKERIFWIHLISGKSLTYSLANSLQLKDLFISRDFIYLLLENEVHLYPIKE